MQKETAFNCPSAWRENAQLYREFVPSNPKCIVEIGVDYGFSLFTMARDFPDALVVGVDNFSYKNDTEAIQHLKNHLGFFPNIRILQMDSVDARKLWSTPDMFCDIDILHIDGDHSYEGVKNDFDIWSGAVAFDGVIMFHDIKSFPESVGKFFGQLDAGEKKTIDIGAGLGFYYKYD